MIENVIKKSNIVRKVFEQIAKDRTLTETLLEHSKDLISYIEHEKTIEYEKNAYITLGIAFAIQTMLMTDKAISFNLKRRIVFLSLRQLLKGISEYENRRWKAECAFWSIFVFCKNELYTNDILCDILEYQGEKVTNENLSLMKFQIISYLFDLTIEKDPINKTFTPLFNERNGLNADLVVKYYNEWTEEGFAAICKNRNLLKDDSLVFNILVKVISKPL